MTVLVPLMDRALKLDNPISHVNHISESDMTELVPLMDRALKLDNPISHGNHISVDSEQRQGKGLRKFRRYNREEALKLKRERETKDWMQQLMESERDYEVRVEKEREKQKTKSSSYDRDPGEFEARHYSYAMSESNYHSVYTIEAAKAAINHHNESILEEERHLCLVNIVYCTADLGAGWVYRVAFEAVEVGSGKVNLYQAKVWMGMVLNHFFMFREAPPDVRRDYYESFYNQRCIQKLRRAVATIQRSERIWGTIYFTQKGDDPIIVSGEIYGLQSGVHCWHIHSSGDITNGILSIGRRLDLVGEEHGASRDGNCGLKLCVEMNGSVLFTAQDNDNKITLYGPNSIIGRTVVVHPIQDNLGCVVHDGHQLRSTAEKAGQRVAYGVIGLQLNDSQGLKYIPRIPPRPFTYYN